MDGDRAAPGPDGVPANLPASALTNSVGVLLAKGTLAGVRIVFLLSVARRSDPALFGELALCFAVVEVLRVAADFGTETLFLRRIARTESRHEAAARLGELAAFRLLATLLGLAAYAAVVVALFGRPVDFLHGAPGALLLTSLGINYAFTWFQARLRMDRAAAWLVGLTPLYAAAAFAPGDRTPEVQLALLLAYELLTCAVLLLDLRRASGVHLRDLARGLSGTSLRAIARDTLPLAGSALLITAYTRLDVFAVERLAGAVALGFYSFAFRVTEPFRFVAGAIDATLYGHLSARFASSRGGRNLDLGRLAGVVVGYALLLAAGAAAAGYFLTVTLFREYAAAVPTLLALSAALCLRCMNAYMSVFQNALGRHGLVFRFALLNAVLMILVVYPLTMRLGYLGAAVALLVVESVNLLVQGRYYLRAARELRAGQA